MVALANDASTAFGDAAILLDEHRWVVAPRHRAPEIFHIFQQMVPTVPYRTNEWDASKLIFTRIQLNLEFNMKRTRVPFYNLFIIKKLSLKNYMKMYVK